MDHLFGRERSSAAETPSAATTQIALLYCSLRHSVRRYTPAIPRPKRPSLDVHAGDPGSRYQPFVHLDRQME
jgi:hypothetical protein